ncbi:50S ribosomal protein L22 [Planctomycetota bacterium]
MLSADKLKELCQERQVTVGQLAGHLVRGSRDRKAASTAAKNWKKGLFKPQPTKDDIDRMASALGVEANELMDWHCKCRYAPLSARKARLVTQLIVGRSVQDAIDVLKFTRKRAAPMVGKLLKCALADADEQQADVESLIVKEARVDDAGRRLGTKQWIAKDRGRAHPMKKRACHIHVTVTQE